MLSARPDRRELLTWGGAAALGALLAACASPTPTAQPTKPVAPPPPAPAAATAVPAKPAGATVAPQAAATSAPAAAGVPAAGAETVYVFNVGSKDVTLIDVASRKVRETRPLGAQVRWLSNEQPYWDGERIWTYDFPNDKLQAIAIDPKAVEVTKTIADIGKGPGHSLVVLPDKKKAAINVAGDDLIAFLDLPSGKIDGTMKTGAFP